MTWKDDDEATMYDGWRSRPMIGDIVELIDPPNFLGTVVDTFYRNGEGGLHVRFGNGVRWVPYFILKVTRRWYLRE